MKMPSDQELFALLTSGDPRLAKRGLQIICDAIDAGRKVDVTRDRRMLQAIAELKSSDDVLVRRWLYKIIALLDLKPLAKWVEGQLYGHELDEENISWAVGCLAALVGPVAARGKLARADLDPNSTSFLLAADYFRHGPPVDTWLLRRTLDDSDPVAHKWLSMRFGKDQTAFSKAVLPDLATSDNDTVVEYAIWATHRTPAGRLDDLPIFPQDLVRQPANVRRWYMRLILKHDANLDPYLDVIVRAMSDPDHMVREGVAIGLADVTLESTMAEHVATWFTLEPEPLVRLALARLMTRTSSRFPFFKALLTQERETSDSLSVLILPHQDRPRPARIFLSVPNYPRRRPVPPSPIPTITHSQEDEAYILGVDTANFSTRSDRQQFTIFRDLLDALRYEDLVVRTEDENVAVLLTGDGAFICFRGARHRLAPLQLGISLQRSYEALRAYQLRFGVNSGPATWITFDEGNSTQLISHAVNWTARVMSAATAGQVLISDPYYRQYVIPARDQFSGLALTEVQNLTTKHGEAIAAWNVTVTPL